MNKITLVQKNLVQPAIFNLKLKGIGNENAYIQDWGWVYLIDLFDCVRDSFRDSDGYAAIMNQPVEVFERYGLLCKHRKDQPLYTWVCGDYYAVDSSQFPSNERLKTDTTFIPAGWAMRIIQLTVRIENKVTHVRSCPNVWHEEGSYAIPYGFLDLKIRISPPFLGPFV